MDITRVPVGVICKVKTWWGVSYNGTIIDKKRKKLEDKLPLFLEIKTSKGYDMLIDQNDIISCEAVEYDEMYFKSLLNYKACNKCGSEKIGVAYNNHNGKVKEIWCGQCRNQLWINK